MNAYKSSACIALIATIIAILYLPGVCASKPSCDDFNWDVEFVGWETTPDGIKFIYNVTTYTQPSISYWKLWSCVFTDYNLIDAGGDYLKEIEQEDGWIKYEFDDEMFDPEGEGSITAQVWFEVDAGYVGIGLGDVEFEIKGGRCTVEGWIRGPICGTDFVINENLLGTLGVLAASLAALGLLAWKRNLISISVK